MTTHSQHNTMALAIILVSICVGLLIMIATYIHRKNKDLPPGPYGLPLVGFLPFLGRNPVVTMANLKKRYGNVVRISLGQQTVVILNDWQAVKDALIKQGATFSGRMILPVANTIIGNKDIIFTDGQTWKEQRQISLHILREFGFGRSLMENVIVQEVDQLSEYLIHNTGKPIEIAKLFFLPVLNIIWGITAGKRFEKPDEFILDFKKFLRILTSGSTYNIINCFPFLQWILFKLTKHGRQSRIGVKKLREYLEQEVANHIKNFEENDLKDFIDFYLAEIYKHQDKNGKTVPPYNKEHLVSTIFDFSTAGSDTVDMTLCWAFLYMANEPNIQGRIQEELDQVITKDSFLSISSKELAPYTEATLLEIQRHVTVAPLAVPHRVTKDTTLLGYKIPSGTMIYPNLYAVHHDVEYWGDPGTFRPDRFLDETGKKVIRPEYFVPFSAGPRACMGDSLAKLELHLFFTCLLRRFTFETVPGEPKPSMEPVMGNLFVTHPFSLIVKPR